MDRAGGALQSLLAAAPRLAVLRVSRRPSAMAASQQWSPLIRQAHLTSPIVSALRGGFTLIGPENKGKWSNTRLGGGWGEPGETQDSRPGGKQGWISCYATCFPGLEEVVAMELASSCIGAKNIFPAKAGVEFMAPSMEVAFRANLWLRSAIRVLIKMAEGDLNPNNSGAEEIYNFTRNAVDWTEHLYDRGLHFNVTGHTASCTDIRSSMLVSTRVKDAVCDAVRSAAGWKPNPAPKGEEPVVQIVANTFQDRIVLYRNMSGDSLHRRGYREAMHKAALNESTAAGALLLLGWDKLCDSAEEPVLVDPMCGSGTFLIEAALIATRRAPGLTRRKWPFQGWHDFDEAAWDRAVASAEEARRPWSGQILGSDIHEGALWLAKTDVDCAEVADIVKLKMTWTELGLFLKRECRTATVGILNGENRALTKELCLKADRRIPLSVGGVDARLLKYYVMASKGDARGDGSRGPAQPQPAASSEELRESSARLLDLLPESPGASPSSAS